MTEIEVSTQIHASRERCFDLARSQSTHIASAKRTQERITEGPIHDLLQDGDKLTFQGKHFGIRFQLSARLVEFERPVRFVDQMEKGPFRILRHEHLFWEKDGITTMVDRLSFAAPFGLLGLAVEKVFLAPHLRRFLRRRAEFLRAIAEGSLPADQGTSLPYS